MKMNLKPEDVQWVVNNLAELGVKIGDQFFFLYKGDSLCYENPNSEGEAPMTYRTVGKREFGECCHPVNYKDPTRIGTVSQDDSDRWQPLPAQRHTDDAQRSPYVQIEDHRLPLAPADVGGNEMSTENRMLHVMRAMAGQRAKGEMASMLEAYYRDLDGDKFARFQEAVTAFEKHVEDEGLQSI